MHTLAMSALLFHSLAATAILLGAVISCLPRRRSLRTWVAALPPTPATTARPVEAELLRAA
jgi:hypothetical protein